MAEHMQHSLHKPGTAPIAADLAEDNLHMVRFTVKCSLLRERAVLEFDRTLMYF